MVSNESLTFEMNYLFLNQMSQRNIPGGGRRANDDGTFTSAMKRAG